MTTHVRKAIRDIVVDVMSGLSVDNVLNMHASAIYDTSTCNVITLAEDIVDEYAFMSTTEDVRSLEVELRIYSTIPSDGDTNPLDALVTEAEDIMLNDSQIDAVAFYLEHDSTSYEYDQDAENQIGVATVRFTLQYITDGQDPYQIAN